MTSDLHIRFHLLPIGVTFKLEGHDAVKHSQRIARVQYWPPEWVKQRMNMDYVCIVPYDVVVVRELDGLRSCALMRYEEWRWSNGGANKDGIA